MDVRLPKLGEGVDSGSVVALFVKEGDVIAKGQTILELENEKAVAPIPSPSDGRVSKIRVKPGDKINVGQVILSLAATTEAAPAIPARPAEEKRPEPAAARQADLTDHPLDSESSAPLVAQPLNHERPSAKAGFPPPAAPSLRRLAKDLGIDLSRVQGSKDGGRIVLDDIRHYIQRLQQAAFPPKRELVVPTAAEPIDFSQWGPVASKPMSSLRKVISRRMSESWSTIPHVTQFDEADITELLELRKRYTEIYQTKGGHLTVTTFVVKAIGMLLKKHAIFNASLDETSQSVVFKQYFHIGLAVDTDAGLVVPVLRDVDCKSLLQISKEIQELSEKARDRKLSLEEMKGGTFTVSNQGGIGSAQFTPIINKPEVAILGVGRGILRPVVRGQAIVPRHMLPLALSYDHRLIDGASAARFMVEFVAALGSFSEAEVVVKQ